MLKISSSALMKPISTLASHFLYFVSLLDSTDSSSAFPTDAFRSKAKKESEMFSHHPFLGLSKLSTTAWVKAHPGTANNQAQGKHPRNMQCLVLWEVTLLSRLAFLPLLEVSVLSDPMKADSCWYKHDKGQDFLPHFPPAGIEAIHRIME